MTLKEELELADYMDDLDEANKMIDLMARAILNYDDQLVINRYKSKEDVIICFREFLEEEQFEMTEREKINSKTLDLINTKDVDRIEIRKIGLLDVFGKIEIDIYYKNQTVKELVAYSPIDIGSIQNWLKKDNLFEKAIMYEF